MGRKNRNADRRTKLQKSWDQETQKLVQRPSQPAEPEKLEIRSPSRPYVDEWMWKTD